MDKHTNSGGAGMKYQTGQIIFFKGKSLYSKLIQSYNLINYNQPGFSHVGIITEVKKNTVVIHEALGQGFVKNDYEKWWLNNKMKLGDIEAKMPKGRLSFVKKHADKYLGSPYGWLDIASICFAFITGFKFISTGSKHLICSEAVARILYDASRKRINFEMECKKPYDLINPMDIYLSNICN